jgi:hypothetical protein
MTPVCHLAELSKLVKKAKTSSTGRLITTFVSNFAMQIPPLAG